MAPVRVRREKAESFAVNDLRGCLLRETSGKHQVDLKIDLIQLAGRQFNQVSVSLDVERSLQPIYFRQNEVVRHLYIRLL